MGSSGGLVVLRINLALKVAWREIARIVNQTAFEIRMNGVVVKPNDYLQSLERRFDSIVLCFMYLSCDVNARDLTYFRLSQSLENTGPASILAPRILILA